MDVSRRPTPVKRPAEIRRLLARLEAQHPGANTELRYSNPYELLVATILSAQCTDARVNEVTPGLFGRYPDARALAAADSGDLEARIQPTGFFRAKTRALLGMAAEVVARHGGTIPNRMEDLVELPGVGRKTANVVLGHALGVPGFPVDRHVLRVANRIGLARSDDPEAVEAQLTAALPAERWTMSSDTLILHGRRICKPRPLCAQCAIRRACEHYRVTGGLRPGAPPRPAPSARRRPARGSQRR